MKIELKQWSFEDKESLMAICNAVDRSYLSDRLPNPYTEDSAEWWLGQVEIHEGKDGIYRAICVNDRIVGNISIEQKDDVFVRDAELGYLLLREYSSQGVMTEAVRQICAIAFDKLSITRITAHVYHPNIASARVLIKNGFVQEGLIRRGVFKNGNVYDMQIFGLLK